MIDDALKLIREHEVDQNQKIEEFLDPVSIGAGVLGLISLVVMIRNHYKGKENERVNDVFYAIFGDHIELFLEIENDIGQATNGLKETDDLKHLQQYITAENKFFGAISSMVELLKIGDIDDKSIKDARKYYFDYIKEASILFKKYLSRSFSVNVRKMKSKLR